MKDVAKGALDKFADVLYGVAPGFVALAAVLVADSGNVLGVRDFFGKDADWRGLGAGVVLGLISYALHLALLEDCMMYIARLLVGMPDGEKYTISGLTRARWERSASKGRAAAAQAGLDETYLWLFFLYCSGYLLLAGGVALRCRGQSNGWWVLLGGLAVLIAAFIGDVKTLRHERWLIQNPDWATTEPTTPDAEPGAAADGGA